MLLFLHCDQTLLAIGHFQILMAQNSADRAAASSRNRTSKIVIVRRVMGHIM